MDRDPPVPRPDAALTALLARFCAARPPSPEVAQGASPDQRERVLAAARRYEELRARLLASMRYPLSLSVEAFLVSRR